MIENQRNQLPAISDLVSSQTNSRERIPRVIKNLKSLFNKLRLLQNKEALFKQVLDEQAFEEYSSLPKRELIVLFDSLENVFEESGYFDATGSAVYLEAEILKPAVKQFLENSVLPEFIIANEPDFFSPVEWSIWEAVLNLKQSLLFVDNVHMYSPSTIFQNYFAERIEKFAKQDKLEVHSLMAVNQDLNEISNSLLDYSAKNLDSMSELSLEVYPNARSEVRGVLSDINQRITEGKASPEDFHIILANFRVYRTLLSEEAENFGLEFSIPKGQAVLDTEVGRCFKKYSAWLAEPSIENLWIFYQSNLVKPAVTTESDISRLSDYCEGAVDSLSKNFLKDESKQQFSSQSEHSFSKLYEISKSLGFHRVSFRETNSLKILFDLYLHYFENSENINHRIKGELAQTILEASSFLAELGKVSKLEQVSNSIDLLKQIKLEFTSKRVKLKDAKPEYLLEDQSNLFRAYRELVRSEKKLRFIVGALEGSEIVRQLKGQDLLRWVLNYWCSALSQISLSVDPQIEKPIVTELLDVRGLRGKHSYLLGMTSENFPKRKSEDRASSLEIISNNIENYSPSVTEESVILLRKLMNSSRSLNISYPKILAGKEALAAGVVNQLQQHIDLKEGRDTQSYKLKDDRRTSLLIAQKAGRLSEYQGCIDDSEKLNAALQMVGMQSDSNSVYSASVLETFVDCPTKFFLEKILNLLPESNPLQFHARLEVGNIVHRILERFFSKQKKVNDSNFSDCISLMRSLAREEFKNSSINWDLSVERSYYRDLVIEGLDDFNSDGRRGLLKAALVFQKDLILSEPKYLEYEFGTARTDNPPLVIDSPDNYKVQICGKIDRIDLDEKGNCRIWDYKTSRVKGCQAVVKGENLQLPIYATYVSDHLLNGDVPERAAFISLNKPSRNDQGIHNINSGVLVEQFAFKRGGGFILDKEAGLSRKDEIKSNILELDSKIRAGDFTHRLEADSCPYCMSQPILEENLTEKFQFLEDKPSSKTSLVSTLSLSDEQKIAADATKSVVLRAGAGAGKTHVLKARFIKLLLSGVKAESIVAITFTEKAAQEIRSRIEESIFQTIVSREFDGKVLSDEEIELLKIAKTTLDSAVIGTIHSFCAGVLNSSESKQYFAKVLTEIEKDEMLDIAFSESISRIETESNLRGLLNYGMPLFSIKEVVTRIISKRELLASLISKQSTYKLENQDYLGLIKELFSNQTQDLNEQLKNYLKNWKKDCANWTKDFEFSNDQQRHNFSTLIGLSRKLSDSLEKQTLGSSSEELYEIIGFLKKNAKSTQVRVSKKNQINYWKELRDKLDSKEYQILLQTTSREEDNFSISKIVIDLTNQVYTTYRRLKEKQGAYDFDDLIEQAHQMLCRDEKGSKIQAYLKNKYKHFMVDEFQDTDKTQWEIIYSLYGKGKGKTLFVVGDSQQSIYRFRGAGQQLFDKALEVAKLAEEDYLVDSYRSHPEIISHINENFEKLFALDFYDSGAPKVEGATKCLKLNPKREQVGDRSESAQTKRVQFLELEDKASLEKEAASIALKIAEVLKSVQAKEGKWPELETSSKGSLIAVLCRTGSDLLRTAKALDVVGVPYQISRNRGFFELPEILQLVKLMKALAFDSDKLSLAWTLRSSLFGMKDQDLIEVFVHNDRVEKSQNVCSALEQIDSWRLLAKFNSASRLLKAICSEVELRDVYYSVNQIDEYSNIESFIELLELAELNGETDGSIQSALIWLDRLSKDSKLALTVNAGDKPVVLSTVHAAKGLEYPMVILPFLEEKTRPEEDITLGYFEDKALISLKVEDPESDFARKKTVSSLLLENQEKSKEISEERRIFYVACTRAKDYLIYALRKSTSNPKSLKDARAPGPWLRSLNIGLQPQKRP